MTKKAESRLQLRIKKALIKQCGGKWFKTHGNQFQEAGQPDLIGCVEGIFFGLEVKVPGVGKPSAIQVVTLREWREAGGVACIVESVREAVSVVKAITAAPEKRRKGRKLAKWLRRFVRSEDW